MKEKLLKLDTFTLKIIAIISMTISHISLFLVSANIISNDVNFILQIFGRIAYPLFIFTLYVGLLHTRNIKKYLLRLGTSAAIIWAGLAIINSPLFGLPSYISRMMMNIGNIFLDLFLIALSYFLFIQKNKFIKALAILPFLYAIGCAFFKYYNYEFINDFHFLYDGFLLQYDRLGFLLFWLFYLFINLYNKNIKIGLNNDESLISAYKETAEYKFRCNLICCISIVLVSIICYFIDVATRNTLVSSRIMDFGCESYLVLAGIFVLFYNWKPGLKNNFSKYFFYLYYPGHILIIFLVYYLCFLI